MTPGATADYCEMRPAFRVGELLRNGQKAGSMASWFPDREIHFTYRGRTAIRYLCDLMGLRDAEVLVPSYNCGSETEPLIDGGAKIIPYRVDGEARADVEDLQGLISERTKAVHVTHYFGFPQPIDEIRNLCDSSGLFLIEDCALALFSGRRGRQLGSWGDAAVFSFPKSLSLPDGGALVINNADLRSSAWMKRKAPFLKVARRAFSLSWSALLRRLSASASLHNVYASLYGWWINRELSSFTPTRDPEARLAVPDWMHYRADCKDRALSRFSARLLRSVVEDEVVSLRRRNYMHLASLLPDRAGFTMLFEDLPQGVCPLGLPLVCDDRDVLYKSLLKRGIASEVWWPGFDRNIDWSRFPEARFLKNHVLLLPVHQGLCEKDMEYVAQSLATPPQTRTPKISIRPCP